jgi:hypothetical protein
MEESDCRDTKKCHHNDPYKKTKFWVAEIRFKPASQGPIVKGEIDSCDEHKKNDDIVNIG